ncbi:unnamed protein product, partial [Urochloa humidicola]
PVGPSQTAETRASRRDSKCQSCLGEERELREKVSYGGYGEELHTGAHSGYRSLPDRLRLRHRRRAPPQHGQGALWRLVELLHHGVLE